MSIFKMFIKGAVGASKSKKKAEEDAAWDDRDTGRFMEDFDQERIHDRRRARDKHNPPSKRRK